MKDISIIICTYNPDLLILGRCLKAVAGLKRVGLEVECFLVDNNSSEPVAEKDIVKSFLQQCPWAHVIVEKEQGLTYARLAGFKQTSAPTIIFFDDDNEPDENYLIEVINYKRQHPSVGAFGPGIITVEFTEGAEEWLYQHKGYFQESAMNKEEHLIDIQGFHSCYPYGTGMVLKREVLDAYTRLLLDKKITTTDRKGNSLSSAGDFQMVWLALRLGYPAGRTPLLKINHLIQKKKANRSYVKRFLYAGGASYLPARIEIFPEEKPHFAKQMLSPLKATLLCIKLFVFNFYKTDVDFILAGQLGSIEGYYQVFGKKPPAFSTWLKKRLKLL